MARKVLSNVLASLFDGLPSAYALTAFVSQGEGNLKDSSTSVIDRNDINILLALQADGRLTNAELAARVNVSPATCHRRMKPLFDEVHITGVRAEIAPATVSLGAPVMVAV